MDHGWTEHWTELGPSHLLGLSSVSRVSGAVFPVCYLQDVVQQGDSGLVGFSFCQFEQSADLKTLSVPCVSPLTDDIT